MSIRNSWLENFVFSLQRPSFFNKKITNLVGTHSYTSMHSLTYIHGHLFSFKLWRLLCIQLRRQLDAEGYWTQCVCRWKAQFQCNVTFATWKHFFRNSAKQWHGFRLAVNNTKTLAAQCRIAVYLQTYNSE